MPSRAEPTVAARPEAPRRFLVAISGATGAILAVRLLEELRRGGHTLHLIISSAAVRTLQLEEPDIPVERVKSLADVVYGPNDIAAAPASGGFRHDGMIVIPCSISTVGDLAHGIGHNLLTRSADVTLKERRRLIVVPREAPLHAVHLRNLATLAELGAVVIPPMLAFYQRPRSVSDLVDHVVGKVLDHLEVAHDLVQPWNGPPGPAPIHVM